MKNYINFLENTELFSKINIKDIPLLLNCLNANIKKYNKNEYIWHEGDRLIHIGMVLEGSVQIIRDNFIGTRTILTECNPGDIFGEVFSYQNNNILPISVIANNDSVIMFFNSKNVFHNCSSQCNFHYTIVENMLNIIVQKNRVLSQKNELLSSRTTREKILNYLSIVSNEKKNKTFTIPFNRQELADYLAINRSALSTELGTLKNEGIIEFNKNNFKLLN